MEFYFFNQIRNKTQFVVRLPRVSAFHCTFLPPLPGWNVQNPNKATGCNLLGENLPLPNKHAAGRMLCPEFLLSLQRSPSLSRRQSWVRTRLPQERLPPSAALTGPPVRGRGQELGLAPQRTTGSLPRGLLPGGRLTPPGFCSCGKPQAICGKVGGSCACSVGHLGVVLCHPFPRLPAPRGSQSRPTDPGAKAGPAPFGHPSAFARLCPQAMALE